MPRRAGTSEAAPRPSVVAIGASAGGITALQTLFSGLTKRPNFAVVVIQHLSPGKPSGLAALIRRWCPLTVHEAADGTLLEQGSVYVACPNDVLTLDRGVFRTRSFVDGQRRPGIDTVDAFFESLARDCGAQAIAVVLSGTGIDGAAGALCIKRAGGLVIVQDPLTAAHDSMPRAAIGYGTADYILPLSAIAGQLQLCASRSYERPTTTVSQTVEITRALDAIVGLMREQAGVDLGGYKPTPLLWRIQRRMDVRRVRSHEDYESLLRDDSSELEALVRGIPIHATEFFRDPSAWQVLNDEVIEPLSGDRRPGEPIRAWTSACATGEEAYSVAMLLSERASSPGQDFDFQVFASDASAEIVARASRGAFRTEALSRFPPQRKARFFYEADAVCRVKRALREKMVFVAQDLLTDPPFTNLDLVTCRNLLIYLDQEASRRVLRALHSSLRVGGYLFLGRGEDLPPRQQGFETVSARWHIYRKDGPLSHAPLRVPAALKRARTAINPHRIAVEHEYPSVLIDEEFQILRIHGDTEAILRLPAGQPTHNLLQLAQPQLSEQLKHAIAEALKIRRPVIVSGLRAPGKAAHAMSVRLTPLQATDHHDSVRLLVSFIAERDDAAGSHSGDSGRPSARELSEAVRISGEELDASREEMLALNEELNASNEQLNIANADLNQANSDLQAKIAELEMQGRVLSSGEVATLFLDHELRVRWFTPAASDLFPLRPDDIGRRITDLIPRFEDEYFLTDVQKVMRNGETREAEVRNREGRWFQRRILPYLGDRTVSGVAITFADISVRRTAEGAGAARGGPVILF